MRKPNLYASTYSKGGYPKGKSPTSFDRVHLHPDALCTLFFCPPNFAIAADWRVVPKIALAGGYDDNIFFSRDDKVDSSVIAVRPGLELDYNTLLSSLKLTAMSIFSIIRMKVTSTA